MMPQWTAGTSLAAAWATGKRQLDDLRSPAVGKEAERPDCRTEQRHHRRFHGGSHVHDPSIAPHQGAGALEHRSGAVETELARRICDTAARVRRQSVTDGNITPSSHE